MAANVFKPAPEMPRRANVARPVAPVPAPTPPPAPRPVAVAEPLAEVEPEVAVAAEAPEAPETPRAAPRPARPRSTWSIFSLLDRVTSVDGLFSQGLPVRFLPHLLFVMLLTLLYIGNTHYGNRMSRNIQKLKQETEDLRADYTTLKSDYMEASKQSEVARKVAAIGLVESSSPPFRIAVPAGRLDEAELELMPVLTADTLAARAARDSAAVHRADSLAGRQRRQLLNLPLDDTPEAGPPPPGLDSLAVASGAGDENAGRASASVRKAAGRAKVKAAKTSSAAAGPRAKIAKDKTGNKASAKGKPGAKNDKSNKAAAEKTASAAKTKIKSAGSH
ncbi:FtsL-like putative cell division protein [uncultured Hymenobacter sp.]|uniref:FtsL-like putative cell division protein n=1 Tax=uncultured Hymenobacter sp. TaxID=170016 RepID=UPI0035CB84CE